MKKHRRASRMGSIAVALMPLANTSDGETIVEKHGRLQVSGKNIVDKNNQPVSLAGNSIFWSNFGEGAKFYNAQTVNHLADNWKSTIVRAAIGVQESGGYLSNPTRERNKAIAVADAAIAKGIYVILDWHSHRAEQNTAQAVEFFGAMSQRYGSRDNIIYEIYNEPVNQSWNTIHNYAVQVIAAIRRNDPDNLIVVGTPFYSQRVEDPASRLINDPNVAYTLHFYAGTHHQSLRDTAQRALNRGIPLFVTEWGAINADGNGGANRGETQKWLDFMEANNLSSCNWSVSDKAEGASVVSPNQGVAGLVANNLTATGTYIRGIIRNWPGNQTSNGGGGGNGGGNNGNLALGKPTSQSSTGYGGNSRRANDGNTNGNYRANSVTHTNRNAQAWWEIDLRSVSNISQIKIHNRTDCCRNRLSNFHVLISNTPFNSKNLNSTIGQPGVGNFRIPGQGGRPTTINVNRSGRYIRVQLAGTNFLSLAEVQIFGSGGSNAGITPPSGFTQLQFRHSTKCVDNTGATPNGSLYHQWTCGVHPNRNFIFQNRGGGYWGIQSQRSNRCLDVAAGSTADGGTLHQWNCHNNNINQSWKINNLGGGWFQLESQRSKKCVDVLNSGLGNQARILQKNCNTAKRSQHLKFR